MYDEEFWVERDKRLAGRKELCIALHEEKTMMEQLREDLKRDEGFRSKPYLDSVGVLTIGYGRNLKDVGISQDEAEQMLTNDILVASQEVQRNFPWVEAAPADVKRGLVNMAFNLGIVRLKGFRNTLRLLEQGRYAEAADNALDSLWARQVGRRAERIADLFRGAQKS